MPATIFLSAARDEKRPHRQHRPRQAIGGNASDLLIAGTTSYDHDDSALQIILTQWTSLRSYAERITNLRDRLGPVLGATGIKLKKGETVIEDADADELLGGSELDWLLYERFRDFARDKKGRSGPTDSPDFCGNPRRSEFLRATVQSRSHRDIVRHPISSLTELIRWTA